MISQEVKRYWKAKINIIIALIMFFPTISAILTDLYEKNERFSEIEANIALGFDVSFALTQLEGWNGLFYFERLFSLHTGLLFLTFVVLVIGLGIHIAGNLFSALKTGYGINIITRMAYKSYLKNTIIAQTIYIFTFTLVIFLIILIALIIFGGGPIQTPNISRISRAGAMATPLYLLVLFGIIFYAIISKILLILIASLSCVFLKNKYIIQFIPVVFFVGIYVFTFMLGNLSYLLGVAARALIFEHAHVSLMNIISHNVSLTGTALATHVAFVIAYPLILLIVFFALYKINISKFGKNYL